MTHPFFRWALLSVIVLPLPARAQSFTPNSERYRGMDFADTTRMEFDAFLIGSRNPHSTEVQSVSGPASRFDLKSSGKARREYEHGYQALLKKDLPGAVMHLKKSIDSYPKFVAAHNALGTAYLELGQNEDAKREFLAAVALDPHLPNSFLNLGCAELALKQYTEAVESLRTATALAPLDIQLQLALVYAQFKSKDYSAAIASARQVHAKTHDGAAAVHLYAAMAWAAQDDLNAARGEMQTLLKEDPLSDSADHYHQILEQIEAIETRRQDAAVRDAQAVSVPVPKPQKARSNMLVSRKRRPAKSTKRKPHPMQSAGIARRRTALILPHRKMRPCR